MIWIHRVQASALMRGLASTGVHRGWGWGCEVRAAASCCIFHRGRGDESDHVPIWPLVHVRCDKESVSGRRMVICVWNKRVGVDWSWRKNERCSTGGRAVTYLVQEALVQWATWFSSKDVSGDDRKEGATPAVPEIEYHLQPLRQSGQRCLTFSAAQAGES